MNQPMSNEEKLKALLTRRAEIQRRMRPILEDLEAVVNEIEQELARIDGREPKQRFAMIQFGLDEKPNRLR